MGLSCASWRRVARSFSTPSDVLGGKNSKLKARSGGAAEFVQAPATGLDGHGYFARAMDDWAPRVARFLRRVGAIR